MSPKSVNIEVDPGTKPKLLTVVVFPGEEIEFSAIGGNTTLFFPEADEIFEEPDSTVFSVSSGGATIRRIKVDIFENQRFEKSVGTRGALIVEYAVSCKAGDETYFAEGDSPPRIIIPPRKP